MGANPDFANRVYAVVTRIPRGKVTTYGRIAQSLGEPRAARMVGWALNAAPSEDIPCHRVVNRNGNLTGQWHFGHPEVMRLMLRREGVPFLEDDRVDLTACLWDPNDHLNDV